MLMLFIIYFMSPVLTKNTVSFICLLRCYLEIFLSYVYGKSNMETYVTIFKTDSQREVAKCLRKLKQVLCINLGVRREMGK